MVGVLFDTPTPTHHLAWEFSFPPRILLPLITSHKNANQHKNKKAIYQQRAILGNAAIWYTPSSKYLQCVVWCVVLFFRDMAWRYLSRTGTIWIFCREPWVCGDLNSMSSTSHLIIRLSRSLSLFFSHSMDTKRRIPQGQDVSSRNSYRGRISQTQHCSEA